MAKLPGCSAAPRAGCWLWRRAIQAGTAARGFALSRLPLLYGFGVLGVNNFRVVPTSLGLELQETRVDLRYRCENAEFHCQFGSGGDNTCMQLGAGGHFWQARLAAGAGSAGGQPTSAVERRLSVVFLSTDLSVQFAEQAQRLARGPSRIWRENSRMVAVAKHRMRSFLQ